MSNTGKTTLRPQCGFPPGCSAPTALPRPEERTLEHRASSPRQCREGPEETRGWAFWTRTRPQNMHFYFHEQ